MRVLHFYRTYFPETQGGGEEVIRQICLNSRQHGVTSRVLTLCDEPAAAPLRRREATVYQLKRNLEIASCSMGLSAIAEFHRQAAWADIVHYHFPWPFADLCHFLSRVDKPSVVTYHSDIIRQQGLLRLYRPLMHRFLGSVSRIVATSPQYAASSPVLRCHAAKVDVIPIGICETSYTHPSAAALARAEARWGRDFFLFVGVLRYYKGLRVLLDAARDTPYTLIIAGRGPEEASLKAYIERRRITNVIMAGYVCDEDKMALLALSRAFVLPSCERSEAFGVSLLESAMCARPMISTELGTGTSHVNRDGETGIVVPPHDPAALRAALHALGSDPVQADRMGLNARLRYESHFRGGAMAASYVQLYRTLLREQAPLAPPHETRPPGQADNDPTRGVEPAGIR